MAYYGFDHRYGAHMRDDNGDLIGRLVIFQTRAERDTWLDGGNEYTQCPGARTAVKSKYAARFRRISSAVELFEI